MTDPAHDGPSARMANPRSSQASQQRQTAPLALPKWQILTLAAAMAFAAGAPVHLHAQQTAPAKHPQAREETAPQATLEITGAVPTPLTLTAADLDRMPRTSVALTQEDGKTVSYEGVLLYDLLVKAGVPFGKGMAGKGMAGYLTATGRDGYVVVFALAEIDPAFSGSRIIIADKADGAPLPDKQQPFRIVAPQDKMHARSIYSLVKLEVVRLR